MSQTHLFLLNGDFGMSAMGIICSPGLTHMMGPSSLSVGLCSRRLENVPQGRVLCIYTMWKTSSYIISSDRTNIPLIYILQDVCFLEETPHTQGTERQTFTHPQADGIFTYAVNYKTHQPPGRGIPPTCWWTQENSLQPLHPQHRPDWPAAWPRHGKFPGNMSASPARGTTVEIDQTLIWQVPKCSNSSDLRLILKYT